MPTPITISPALVQQLIREQFPQWADLPIKPVEPGGWDNRTFRLGDSLSIRLPSSECYANQVQKEQHWLPQLAPHLPLVIPKPMAMGKPTKNYPWHWSVYEWIEGQAATANNITNINLFGESLASFLKALQACDTRGGPPASPENFYRGGDLRVYDGDTRKALAALQDRQQANLFLEIWERALSSSWEKDPTWIHGDIAAGNLLVNQGELVAVIDFGQLAIGDPACDLGIYWNFFRDESRITFRDALNLDQDTWDRARGWALWKNLCSPVAGTDPQSILKTIGYNR